MAILDDVCASQHGQKAGADQNLKGKLADNQRQNKYFEDWGMGKVTRLLGWLELVTKELNHLAAILHVYAGGLILMK